MREKSVIKILDEIKKLKIKNGWEIIDTHIHPHDVMGVVHYQDTTTPSDKQLHPGLLEALDYGIIGQIGSKMYCAFLGKKVVSMIASTYKNTNKNNLLKEMSNSLIDKAVLLPIDPWAPTDFIGKQYSNHPSFLLLGSLDVHKTDISEIDSTIKSYIKKYNIVGLKLHPNLQNFKPQPSHNPPEIADKLRRIYQAVSSSNLYLLFHGGTSYYPKEINKKYEPQQRSANNALLENFCDINGRSEIFGHYDMPIIIAHLGHYGIININYRLIETIGKKYKNVFFDTSGASPSIIKKTIDILSSDRIVFGSDGTYNRLAYNIAFLYKAALKGNSDKKIENILFNILGNNYRTQILNK